MSFQNLLLLLGAAALEEFGEGFLQSIFHALWEEDEIVDEGRAEEMLADALGPDGREWVVSRPEFQEEPL
jgi:2-hydroxychromene-2-carboxylate isomerase